MNRAFVVGTPHHNTLGMIRSLGSKGIKTDVFIISPEKKRGDIKSKFVNSIQFFNTAEEIAEYFCEHDPDTGKDVIFSECDEVSAAIDSKYEQLKDKYAFFNTKGHTAEWMNKERMSSLAESIGMNVPMHVVIDTREKLPNSIKFQCITKAISSLYFGKRNTAVCHSREELNSFLSSPYLCRTMQIEEFIEKDIEFQFIGLSLDEGRKVIVPGHSHIDRPRGIQNTYAFQYIDNDSTFKDLLEKAKLFIQSTRFSGLFSMEFIRGKDGKDYFLECNFRNDGNAICVTDSGFNLPYLWYLYNTGGDYEKELSESVFKPVKYIPEYEYAEHFVNGEISFTNLVSTFIKANSFTNYYKGDSPTFFKDYSYYILKCIAKRVLVSFGLRKKSHISGTL